MNEQELEKEIEEKGLTSPRITPNMINHVIAGCQYYVFPGTCLTICCINLINGFTVTGESACASPENFDKTIGEKLAFDQAKNKIWTLEGYLLKQELYLTEM